MTSGLDTTTTDRFRAELDARGLAPPTARGVTTLQVNLGRLCNQACRHCHVDAGPHRTAPQDNASPAVVDAIVTVLRSGAIGCVDITGGAPELNPDFRRLVIAARGLGLRVIDRCNLSVLFEPGHQDLADFLAAHDVEITASLPHYRAATTDRQRGAGVFDHSVEGLRLLNRLGYGSGRPDRVLHLVHNPVGAFLPGRQQDLEADFRRELAAAHGIVFDRLFCITNMPIRRYLDWLVRSGQYERYLQTLIDAFNPAALEAVMCRDLVSVGPDGRLHDCDFNQMLELPLAPGLPRTIFEWDPAALGARPIRTGTHCLGCTAGAGSSCGGQLD